MKLSITDQTNYSLFTAQRTLFPRGLMSRMAKKYTVNQSLMSQFCNGKQPSLIRHQKYVSIVSEILSVLEAQARVVIEKENLATRLQRFANKNE